MPIILKESVVEHERVKHYSPSQICVESDLLKEFSCMPYTMFLLQDEDREDRYMEMVRSAIIEPVLAVQL